MACVSVKWKHYQEGRQLLRSSHECAGRAVDGGALETPHDSPENWRFVGKALDSIARRPSTRVKNVTVAEGPEHEKVRASEQGKQAPVLDVSEVETELDLMLPFPEETFQDRHLAIVGALGDHPDLVRVLAGNREMHVSPHDRIADSDGRLCGPLPGFKQDSLNKMRLKEAARPVVAGFACEGSEAPTQFAGYYVFLRDDVPKRLGGLDRGETQWAPELAR
jgi:hypothetical protein